jgi:hypothetical protein
VQGCDEAVGPIVPPPLSSVGARGLTAFRRMGEVRCSINSPSPRVERVSQSELRFEACGMARLMTRKSGIFHPVASENLIPLDSRLAENQNMISE